MRQCPLPLRALCLLFKMQTPLHLVRLTSPAAQMTTTQTLSAMHLRCLLAAANVVEPMLLTSVPTTQMTAKITRTPSKIMGEGLLHMPELRRASTCWCPVPVAGLLGSQVMAVAFTMHCCTDLTPITGLLLHGLTCCEMSWLPGFWIIHI